MINIFCCGKRKKAQNFVQTASAPELKINSSLVRSSTLDNKVMMRDAHVEHGANPIRRGKRTSTTRTSKKEHPLADYVYPRNPSLIKYK